MPKKSLNLRRAAQRRSPPEQGQPTEDQIARIDALTATGRSNWFALLAYLAFALVTTLAVEDIDFFVDSRQTELPLVGVSIPTFSFFIFAPIIGTALYVYLHLHIRKVSEALSEAPAGSPPLEEVIRPWLLNDFILRRRNDGAIRSRPLDTFAELTTVVLVWWSGPIVLAIMWARTWPAHSLWLSGICAACLMSAIYAGRLSWVKMLLEVFGPATPTRFRTSTALVALLCLPIAWLTTANSKGVWQIQIADWNLHTEHELRFTNTPEWAYTAIDLIMLMLPESSPNWLTDGVAKTWDTVTGLSQLDSPDLAGARLSSLPPEEINLDASRHRYRIEFCDRRGIIAEVCDRVPINSYEITAHLAQARDVWCRQRGYDGQNDQLCREYFSAMDREFIEEWDRYRTKLIEAVEKPNLEGRDLRNVDLSFASLYGVRLLGARLEGANLFKTELERANLREARLEEADLRGARLEGAFLFRAGLEGADLFRARLERANLSKARLEGAYMLQAQMAGANLSHARLEGAVLTEAQLARANLREAWLARANLSGAQLKGADLSRAQMEEADLSGAQLKGADFSSAQMKEAWLEGARLEGTNLGYAQLKEAWLDEAQLNGVDLSHAILEGASLYMARLNGVNLSHAQLKGADLRFSSLFGKAEAPIVLQSTILSAATIDGAALRFVDLRPAASDPPYDLRNSFGDKTVLLPNDVERPCQWAGELLSDEAFHARWRGWIGLSPAGDGIWDWVAPEEWLDVEAVEPPTGCLWQK